MKSARLLLIPAFALSACTSLIGPDHRTPEVALPDRWSRSSSSSTSAISSSWWKAFGDAELNRLQEMALASNQDLEQALRRVEAAEADFRVTRSGLAPRLSTDGSTTRSQSSANNNVFPGFTPPEITQYRVGGSLSYEIDLWGKVRRSAESARASLESTAFARDAVMLSLTGQVAEQYFSLRTLDAESALLAETIELRKTSLELAHTRFDGGLTNESDVTRARSALASAEADAADLIRRRDLTENTLAELCGQAAGSFRISARSQLQKSVPQVPMSTPASLLTQRPDIAETERTLAARSADIGAAIGERLPSLKIKGSLSLESLTLGDLLTSGSRAFSIGPEVTLPVLTGGANKDKVKKAEARHREAEAAYRGSVLAAVKEVEDALASQRGFGSVAERQSAKATAAAQTASLSLERYRSGQSNYLEVVDSQREELQARRSQVQARGNHLAATVQLFKALGGGWKATGD